MYSGSSPSFLFEVVQTKTDKPQEDVNEMHSKE